jgi:hypothetical protein
MKVVHFLLSHVRVQGSISSGRGSLQIRIYFFLVWRYPQGPGQKVKRSAGQKVKMSVGQKVSRSKGLAPVSNGLPILVY